MLLPHEHKHRNLYRCDCDLLSFCVLIFFCKQKHTFTLKANTLFGHSQTATRPGAAESPGMSGGLLERGGSAERGAGSVPRPTARGRGQLEWDSGQLAQRGLQTGAGDWRNSSSLPASGFCLLWPLEVSVSKDNFSLWKRQHVLLRNFP